MRILYHYKKDDCNIEYTVATSEDNSIEYGYLYNWYSVDDARNIANVGWVVPDNANFETLKTYLGGSIAGGKMKEAGTTYWDAPNSGTNESNFNARGAGMRDNSDGLFYYLKEELWLWSADEWDVFPGVQGEYYYIENSSSDFRNYEGDFKYGFSVRLIKESTSLSNGETGTYTGNDGQVYLTICIGTQEWLAENLIETQYRNGDPIPTVEDATTWSGLTTGAKCAYDNNESLVGTSVEENTIEYTLTTAVFPVTVELVGTSFSNTLTEAGSGSFTDIPGGTYILKITDDDNCTEEETIVIDSAVPVALDNSIELDREAIEMCSVSHGFTTNKFTFTDTEGNTLNAIKIVTLPTTGTLTIGLNTSITPGDIITDFSNGFFYHTNGNIKSSHTDTLEFQVRTNNNNSFSNIAVLTFNVTNCPHVWILEDGTWNMDGEWQSSGEWNF